MVLLPKAQHHDVGVEVPGKPHRATFATLVDEDLAATWEGNHLTDSHEGNVAVRPIERKTPSGRN